MSEFALRFNDGDIYPGDTVYVDGYAVADRILEGVRFEVKLVSEEGAKHLACNGVHSEDVFYMERFSDAQKAKWYAGVVSYLVDRDGEATGDDGEDVHWGEG